MIKKKLAIFFLLSSLVLATGFLVDIFYRKVVRIDGQNFIAELPRSQEEYQKGLGGRENLCPHCAMLFAFPQKGKYAFWMKDMQFALDILFLADGKIVYIKKNFAADSAEIARPLVPADNVLEIGAGLSDRYGFQVGDDVSLY